MSPSFAIIFISITAICTIAFHLVAWGIYYDFELPIFFNVLTFIVGGITMVDYVNYSDMVNRYYKPAPHNIDYEHEMAARRDRMRY